MKRLAAIVFLSVLSFVLSAQNGVEYLKTLVTENRVSFNYSLGVKGKAPVVMSGKAVIDGNCYCVRGNGMELYCDGTTKWTVDNESKEVYIEASEGTRDFLANPSAWLDKVTGLKVSGNTASGFYYDDSQEVELSFKFTSISSSPLSGSTSGFVFDADSLGSGWVVTDLR